MLRHVMHYNERPFGDQSSDSGPYESCRESSKEDSSDNAQGAQNDDNFSIHANNESDSERFDPI